MLDGFAPGLVDGGATLLASGVALAAAVCLGTVTHELSHAAVLSWFDVPVSVVWRPDDDGSIRSLVLGRVATVRPVSPGPVHAGALRIAALAPLALAAPLALVFLGILPDPFETGDVVWQAATVGWVACAIPSPGDFALCLYAADAVAPDGGFTDESAP
jgi:hypothetical protein